MKSIQSFLKAMTVSLVVAIFASGCGKSSKPPPPVKSTLGKLNSSDPKEQMEGLNEAQEKYGTKP